MDLRVQIDWLEQLSARGLNGVFPASSAAFTVRLYTNDVTPGNDNSLGDFVEAVGGGYVPQGIDASFVATRVGDVVESAPTDVTFVFTGALTGATGVRGAYLTDAGGHLVAAGRLSEERTPEAGAQLTLPLVLTWGAGTTAAPTGNQPPTAPAISLVGVASGQATVALTTASTDADGTVAGYYLYVDGVASGGLRSWTQGTNQTVGGLTNGVAVAITAKAQDDDGALSVASNAVTATAANQQPTAPTIAVPSSGDGAVTVRLTAPSVDTESGTLTTYEVYANGVKQGADRTGWDVGEDVAVTGLVNGVQYALTAKGKDGAGLLSAASNSVNATPSAAQDTTPDAFTFVDQSGVAVSSTITSLPITVSGISAPAPISVAGGTYNVNGGSFTASAGTVANGDQVRVRHTSSASFSTATDTTLTIGGVSDTFTSTTAAQDTVPDAFDFADQTGVSVNAVIVSAPQVLTGFNSPAVVSALTGGLSYRLNGTGSWIAATGGTVAPNDSVEVRLTSSASYETQVSGTITIGGVSDTFAVTTGTADTTPDAFSFTDQTNVPPSTLRTSSTITVSGINAAAAISVTGGEYAINGGSWTSSSGTVTNGQTVQVRHTSSNLEATAVNTVLTIGGVSDTFTSTTVDYSAPFVDTLSDSSLDTNRLFVAIAGTSTAVEGSSGVTLFTNADASGAILGFKHPVPRASATKTYKIDWQVNPFSSSIATYAMRLERAASQPAPGVSGSIDGGILLETAYNAGTLDKLAFYRKNTSGTLVAAGTTYSGSVFGSAVVLRTILEVTPTQVRARVTSSDEATVHANSGWINWSDIHEDSSGNPLWLSVGDHYTDAWAAHSVIIKRVERA